MAAKLTGRTQPRLWTPPLRTLTRRTTRLTRAFRHRFYSHEPLASNH